MSVNIPICTAESLDILILPVNPRDILNNPERKPGHKERNSHIREWLINNEKRVKIVKVLKKEVSYERDGSMLRYDAAGHPIASYRYEVPAPIDGQIPEDVLQAVRNFFGIDTLTVTPTPKQLALDWALVFKKPRVKVPWTTSKAAGVANQPGRLPLGDLDIPIIVSDAPNPEQDGYLAVDYETMKTLAVKFNIANSNGEPTVPTAIKLSGTWPTCSKFIIGCDPNSAQPLAPFKYCSCNDKGEPRENGLSVLKLKDFRLVQNSDQYFKIGCGLSYQVLSLAENWAKIGQAYIKPSIDILKGIIRGKADAMIKAMEIDKIFEIIPGEAYDEDGKRREFYQQAEFLLAAGATPKNHPKVQKAMWKTAHFFSNRLASGIFVKDGHMAYALPSSACKRGEVILSYRAWKAIGCPTEATVVRYPINQRNEIRKYKIKTTVRKNLSSDRAIFVNAEDWHEFHNGDFDGDLCFVYNIDIVIKAEDKIELSKGTGRESKSPYEEAYKTCQAGASVGAICNMLTFMRAIKQCYGYHTDSYQKMLAEAYHTAIQATKNCDFDHRAIMRTCQVMLKQLGLETTMPWLTKSKRVVDPDTLELLNPEYDAIAWNEKVATLSTLDKRWNKCLLGWVHGKIALCGTFRETTLIPFNRNVFVEWMNSENGRRLPHEEYTSTLLSAMYAAMQAALDESKLTGNKVNFKEVLVQANKVRKLNPAERDAAAVLAGHHVATTKASDWLFSLIAPIGIANDIYGGKQINNVDGILRNMAQKALVEEAEERLEEEALMANDISLLPPSRTQAENPSIIVPPVCSFTDFDTRF